MVSQSTSDFIYNVIDSNNEYNTKLLLLAMFAVYLIFSLWWANKIIPWRATMDERGKFPVYQQISVKLMRVTTIPLLFFSPLIVGIVMYRGYGLDSMLTLLITGYSITTLIGLGLWFLFGMHWVQEFLALIGIDTGSSKKGRFIRRRE